MKSIFLVIQEVVYWGDQVIIASKVLLITLRRLMDLYWDGDERLPTFFKNRGNTWQLSHVGMLSFSSNSKIISIRLGITQG